MAADTTAPALAPPPNGCLASVVTAYHCAVRHQKYTWDFMFDVAPPRNLPHPDCPGRPGGGRCVMVVGPAPTPHCDRPGCRSHMTILSTHSAHGAPSARTCAPTSPRRRPWHAPPTRPGAPVSVTYSVIRPGASWQCGAIVRLCAQGAAERG
jgi:hypothetical protein